jgi:hypothetical protein
MTNIDQFDSVFRAASRSPFEHRLVTIGTVLVVTDLDADRTAALVIGVRQFLSVIDGGDASWPAVIGDEFGDLRALLDLIEQHQPDLIVTYRHLHSEGWNWPYSLGEYVDVMTQATTTPVIVLPHPGRDGSLPGKLRGTDTVMAITDHLTGDHRLVNYALSLTRGAGTCWLTHVESAVQFERYMEVISKIPNIDTDQARQSIAAQLLKEPADYIQSCRGAADGETVRIKVEEITIMGRRLEEYRRLIEAHNVDLLILNTKDEDQLAMHGLAYPLAVELRDIAILML